MLAVNPPSENVAAVTLLPTTVNVPDDPWRRSTMTGQLGMSVTRNLKRASWRQKHVTVSWTIAKRSFNMDTAQQAGIAGMGMYALKLYYDTDESREGVKALQEKRKPDFRKFAK